jgi:hypothetical protein
VKIPEGCDSRALSKFLTQKFMNKSQWQLVAHSANPGIQEAEIKRITVQSQP